MRADGFSSSKDGVEHRQIALQSRLSHGLGRAEGSCADVEKAVAGSRAAEPLHWLRVYGVVDGDGLDADQIVARRERGVYALPFYSAEAVYFHPAVIARIASRQSSVHGTDEAALVSAATEAGVAAVRDHTERLSKNSAKKAIRKAVLERIPNDDELLAGDDLHIENHAETIRAAKNASWTPPWAGTTGGRS